MGRIKTKLIKRITKRLVNLHPDDFKEDFDENKLLVEQFATFPSKKVRNVVAGYVTRLTRTKKDY